MPTFSPPTTAVKHPDIPPPFNRMGTPEPVSVLKFGDFFRATKDPSAEDVELADAAYLGGRTYTISSEEAAALTAAGYQVDA